MQNKESGRGRWETSQLFLVPFPPVVTSEEEEGEREHMPVGCTSCVSGRSADL